MSAGTVERTDGVTHAMEDYLKAVYRLQESGVVSNQRLADELGVSRPSVTSMVKRLDAIGLLRHSPYHGAELTDAGRVVALEVLRHHRLLELYLVRALGVPWDQAHGEAERLEHHLSEELEARMDSVLGFPTRDPHGHPIPSREGRIETVETLRLIDLEPGTSADVTRVPDHDPDQLRYLGGLGITPGATVTVVERLPFEGPIRIVVGGDEHFVGRGVAAAVQVSAA